jgi:hypothetical protein
MVVDGPVRNSLLVGEMRTETLKGPAAS